jgi:LysE type translocator
MTLSTYLLYLAAVTLLLLTPGPVMLMALTNSLNHGPWRALASLSGSLAAAMAIMMLSALGLGAVLAVSEAAFTTLKIVGAAYLVWPSIDDGQAEIQHDDAWLKRNCLGKCILAIGGGYDAQAQGRQELRVNLAVVLHVVHDEDEGGHCIGGRAPHG